MNVFFCFKWCSPILTLVLLTDILCAYCVEEGWYIYCIKRGAVNAVKSKPILMTICWRFMPLLNSLKLRPMNSLWRLTDIYTAASSIYPLCAATCQDIACVRNCCLRGARRWSLKTLWRLQCGIAVTRIFSRIQLWGGKMLCILHWNYSLGNT